MASTIQRKIKRFLFIGPTGVGKSILIILAIATIYMVVYVVGAHIYQLPKGNYVSGRHM
jgi:superfamily II DNA or RNA helicase